jgi:hypothetical protein
MGLIYNPKSEAWEFSLAGLRLSKRQRAYISERLGNGDIDSASRYVNTFRGLLKRRVHIDRFNRDGSDPLLDTSNRIQKYKRQLSNLLDPFKSHYPVTKLSDYIGVEIECLVPNFDGCDSTVECDSCDGSGHQYDEDDCQYECEICDGGGRVSDDNEDRSNFTQLGSEIRERKILGVSIKSDGSIRDVDGYFGVELTVLTKVSDFSNLKQLCDLLNDLGARVNASCGMHVHLDARHLDREAVKAVGRRFASVLPLLSQMVPASRRSNTYCKLGVSKLKGNNRYYAVNLTAWSKYKTVEVRLHSSTTSFDKISNWVTLLHSVMCAKRVARVVTSLNQLTDYIYLPEPLLEYFEQRISLFAEQSSSDVATDRDSLAS